MTETEAAVAPTRREIRLVFAGLMLCLVMASLDQNIVNTALPRIVSDLGGLNHLSWIVTSFMLAGTTTTPLYGKLSDMYGRKRLLVIAIVIFLAGSALCGFAQSMVQLIVFRGVQGLGAGGLLTLSQTVVGDLVSPRERPRYQGLFTGAFAVSSVAGPLLGGFLTEALNWRWVFYVNLPVGAATLALIAIALRPMGQRRRHKVDYVGAATLAVATAAFLLVLSWGGSSYDWGSPELVGLGTVSAAFYLLFFLQEGRAAEPIIGIHLFRIRIYAGSVLAQGLMMFAMLGSTVFLPLYFQLVVGKAPAVAGMLMLPQIAGMLCASVVGGRLVAWSGRYKPFVMGGLAVEAAALTALAVSAIVGAPVVAFELALAGLGLGMGAGMPNLTTAIQNAVERRDLGVATATMGFVRSLGGSLGVALSGGVMAARLKARLADQAAGIDIHGLLERGIRALATLSAGDRGAVVAAYRHAIAGSFMVSAVVMTLAFLLVITIPAAPLRGRSEEAAVQG